MIDKGKDSVLLLHFQAYSLSLRCSALPFTTRSSDCSVVAISRPITIASNQTFLTSTFPLKKRASTRIETESHKHGGYLMRHWLIGASCAILCLTPMSGAFAAPALSEADAIIATLAYGPDDILPDTDYRLSVTHITLPRRRRPPILPESETLKSLRAAKYANFAAIRRRPGNFLSTMDRSFSTRSWPFKASSI